MVARTRCPFCVYLAWTRVSLTLGTWQWYRARLVFRCGRYDISFSRINNENYLFFKRPSFFFLELKVRRIQSATGKEQKQRRDKYNVRKNFSFFAERNLSPNYILLIQTRLEFLENFHAPSSIRLYSPDTKFGEESYTFSNMKSNF